MQLLQALAQIGNNALSAWPESLIRGCNLAGAVACAMLLLILSRRAVVEESTVPRMLRGAAAICAAAIIVVYALLVVTYPALHAYGDHGEPNVVMLAAWRNSGHLLYPSWTAGEGFYGLIYGPLLFQLEGGVIAAMPTITGSKLPGVIACLMSYVMLWRLLASSTKNNLASFLLLGMTLLVAVTFANATFWVRPEPFLVLLTVVGLSGTVRLKGMAAAICLGLACGAATGFKLSAPVYFVGPALSLLASQSALRDRLRVALAGGLVWAVMTAAPFVDPTVTIPAMQDTSRWRPIMD